MEDSPFRVYDKDGNEVKDWQKDIKRAPKAEKKPEKKPKGLLRARSNRRVNTAANLTDEEIADRNRRALASFRATVAAANRGSNQSKTKIRVNNSETKITGGKNAQQAKREAERRGIIKPKPQGMKHIVQQGAGTGDPYGSFARAVSRKKKSLDEVQGFIQGMLQVVKREEGFKTRVTGVNLGTKIRNKPQEGKIRDKPQEVQTGPNYNLQTRIGDPAEKAIIAKSELNSAFNGLLDAYQSRWFNKNIFDEARANPKKPHLKGERSAKKTPQGSDKETPAIGSTTEDQKVMTS